MPHLVIEYARELEQQLVIPELLSRVHQAAVDTGLFDPAAVKVRALAFDHYLVAGQARAFVHLRAEILSGRSEAQKKQLSRQLLDELSAMKMNLASLTVDVIDMDRSCYAKQQH